MRKTSKAGLGETKTGTIASENAVGRVRTSGLTPSFAFAGMAATVVDNDVVWAEKNAPGSARMQSFTCEGTG